MNPVPGHPNLIPDRILRGMGVSFLKDSTRDGGLLFWDSVRNYSSGAA